MTGIGSACQRQYIRQMDQVWRTAAGALLNGLKDILQPDCINFSLRGASLFGKPRKQSRWGAGAG